MGDENQPSKKRAAGRELSRDNPGLDDEEESEEQLGTFKKAADEVLAARKIVKVRRQQTSTAPSAPSSNPFAGIRLVPPPTPAVAPAETQAAEARTGSEDADTKDDANSESEVKKVDPEEKPNETITEPNTVEEKEASTEQTPVISQHDQTTDDTAERATETKPSDEREADGIAEKRTEAGETKVKPSDERETDGSAERETDDSAERRTEAGETKAKPSDERETDDNANKRTEAGETKAECDKNENDGKNEDEKPKASGGGGAPLSSFQQLSNSQNAFTGLAGTGFSSLSFSFGSLPKDGSPSQSLPTFKFGTSTNGSSPLFGTGMTGTSITKTEGPTFRSMQEVPTETGEENEETVFAADSALFEFLNGVWKERGKGEVKLNLLKGETQKARLVMRAKGNLRLILNASLFPDMKFTKMDKKGITFACVNIATEGKDGLSTFALKFKDGLVMEEFFSAVSAHKDKPAATALKTPENSHKASDF